jgi:cellulose biosynthesis protein BcsQ
MKTIQAFSFDNYFYVVVPLPPNMETMATETMVMASVVVVTVLTMVE